MVIFRLFSFLLSMILLFGAAYATDIEMKDVLPNQQGSSQGKKRSRADSSELEDCMMDEEVTCDQVSKRKYSLSDEHRNELILRDLISCKSWDEIGKKVSCLVAQERYTQREIDNFFKIIVDVSLESAFEVLATKNMFSGEYSKAYSLYLSRLTKYGRYIFCYAIRESLSVSSYSERVLNYLRYQFRDIFTF